MAGWVPDDDWPSGTRGGACAPSWGGYVRLWVRAALAAGNTWTLGPHEYDRLDDGNVLGGAPIIPPADEPPLVRARAATRAELWIDLSCDVLDVDVQGGASASEGVFTKPDAATCEVTLRDPERKYDPLNGAGPYALGNRSRLVPGTPVDVFAEVVNGDTGEWSRHWLFSGTADSWGEEWTPRPSQRVAKLVATGESKWFVNMNRPDTDPPVGDGDTTTQRVQRIVDESGWLGMVEADDPTVTFLPTKLSGDGWGQLTDTLENELGFVYFTADGALRWVGRAAWTTFGEPVVELGCGEGRYDVLTAAEPSTIALQLRNAVFAKRDADGATTIAVQSTSSIDRYGRFDYSAESLALRDDVQVGEWARVVLQLYAFPQISLADVTALPGIAERSWELWAKLLALRFVTDLVGIYWAPPDDPESEPVDSESRVVGFHHTITRASWEVVLQLIDAHALAYTGSIFTLGPHANDRLDAGFVLG